MSVRKLVLHGENFLSDTQEKTGAQQTDDRECHFIVPAGYLYIIFSCVSDFINSMARICIMDMTLGFVRFCKFIYVYCEYLCVITITD